MSQDTLTARLVAVRVERGREVIALDVPKHEVDVLRAVHGPANVHEGAVTDEEMVLPVSADAEITRLQGKYKRINAPDPVLRAYPTGASALVAFGFELHRGAREEAPMAGIRKHPKVTVPEPLAAPEKLRKQA